MRDPPHTKKTDDNKERSKISATTGDTNNAGTVTKMTSATSLLRFVFLGALSVVGQERANCGNFCEFLKE